MSAIGKARRGRCRWPGRIMAVLAGLAVLSACGGGGSSGPRGTVSGIPVGPLPSDETAGDQAARLAGIVTRMDLLSATAVHGVRTERFGEEAPNILDPDFSIVDHGMEEEPERALLAFDFECAATRCAAEEGDTVGGVSTEIEKREFGWISARAEERGSRHGLTLVRSQRTGGDGSPDFPDIEYWGAWGDYSGFLVLGGRSFEETGSGGSGDVVGYDTVWVQALAGGELSGSRPFSLRPDLPGQDLIWRGLMVGSEKQSFVPLQGDTTVRYDLGDARLSVSFTDIRHAGSGALYRVPTLRLQGVDVSTNGSFEAGVLGNRIRGGFYGQSHDEVGGVFEQADLVGAFGAKRSTGN